MQKLLPYLSACGIILFIYFSLFASGKNTLSDLEQDVVTKKEQLENQYSGIKENVEDFSDTVTETKEKLDNTIQTVNETKATVENLSDKVKYYLKLEDATREITEPWQESNPELDPSIDAGRENYNYADPGQDGLSKAHLELDIKPWIEWGNSEEDITTKKKRIEELAETEQGRKILEKLGYGY